MSAGCWVLSSAGVRRRNARPNKNVTWVWLLANGQMTPLGPTSSPQGRHTGTVSEIQAVGRARGVRADRASPRVGLGEIAAAHFLKTRHGIEVCRRRVAKLINGNPMIDEKIAPRDIEIMIKSHLEGPV
jgi:hypothetical protein